MSQRVLALTAAWHSTNVVKTREKVVFFFAVMSVMFTALMFGTAPEYVLSLLLQSSIRNLLYRIRWIHIAYTVQAAFLLPLRVYKYKKRSWHYFLFDLCYYCNILNFVYIWLIPSSPAMFVACYCLAHGSLASAVITWRNSLVFHDFDKVTSLFIHIYPPIVFTVIRCVTSTHMAYVRCELTAYQSLLSSRRATIPRAHACSAPQSMASLDLERNYL